MKIFSKFRSLSLALFVSLVFMGSGLAVANPNLFPSVASSVASVFGVQVEAMDDSLPGQDISQSAAVDGTLYTDGQVSLMSAQTEDDRINGTAFAVRFENESSVLYFYKRLNKPAFYSTFEGKKVVGIYSDIETTTECEWQKNGGIGSSITDVVFVDEITPVSTAKWFFGFSQMSSIDLSKLNTSKVTNMKSMFSGSKFSTLDLSKFTTSNVIDMSNMFDGASVTTLDLSNFDVKNVTNMQAMFNQCISLSSLALGDFESVKVTNMQAMFQHCRVLERLTFINFKTDAVTNMKNMFSNCCKISSLDLSSFKTDNVTDMSGMFITCSELQELDLNNFDTSKVVNMSNMFKWCISLNSLKIDSWNTGNVTDMSGMFQQCEKIRSLDVSNFNVSNVETFSSMFSENSALETLDLERWRSGKVINMNNMFYKCFKLNNLKFGDGFIVDKVNYMSGVFMQCNSLTSLDLSSWNTSNVTAMNSMFNKCSGLINIYVSNLWNTNIVSNSTSMFAQCFSLSNFNSAVIDKTNAHYNAGGYLTYKPLALLTPPTTGPASDSATWNFSTEFNTLTLTPTNPGTLGTIPDYTTSTKTPWKDYKDTITNVEVSGITSLGNNSLSDLSNANDVKLDNTVQTIGNGAFKNDAALTQVELPENLITIKGDAFKGTGLTEIIIPPTVTTIEDGAFADNENLTKVTFTSPTPPTIGSNAFTGSAVLADTSEGIIVPAGTTAAYTNALPPVMSNSITAVAPKSNVTINIASSSDNITRKYNAYKIFSGDIISKTTMSNLVWVTPEIKAIVLSKLGLPETTTAQQAAEALRNQIGASDVQTVLTKSNIGMEIALAIQALTPSQQFAVGVETPVENGYYIMTGDAFTSPTTNVMATSPIYTIVGAGELVIAEKASLPILTLQIKEDSDGLWKKTADHSYGQLVDYRTTFSLPKNFASFTNYQAVLNLSANGYDFANIPNNKIAVYLDKDGDGIVTTADKISSGFTIANNGVATKDSANEIGIAVALNSLSNTAGVEANSKVIVDFSAPAPSDKNNRKMFAYLGYTSNPVAPTEIGQTTWDVVDDYSYNMKLNKQDKATSDSLAGAKFIVKNKDGLSIAQDTNGKAYELAPTDTAYEWITGSDGVLNISGVDADEYTIEEIIAPDSYTKLSAPFKVIMTANYSGETPTIQSDLGGTFDSELVALQAPATGFAADVIIKNVKNLNLPFTGEQGIAMLIGLGSVLVIAGMGVQLRKRRSLNIDIHKMK